MEKNNDGIQVSPPDFHHISMHVDKISSALMIRSGEQEMHAVVTFYMDHEKMEDLKKLIQEYEEKKSFKRLFIFSVEGKFR
jgi:ERCC4-related helicase